MIDYIFFSGQLMRTVGLLGPLDIDWLKGNKILGFPHPHVPSDHLPLMVELELINPNLTVNNLNSYFGSSAPTNNSSNGNTNNNGGYQHSSSGGNLSRPSAHHHHHHSQHHNSGSFSSSSARAPLSSPFHHQARFQV